ncbi:MAG: FHA domain-containing protein, partial [Synechococcales cyanobacterium]
HLLSDPEFSGLAIRVIVGTEKLLARRTSIMTTTGQTVHRELESAGIRHSNWKSIHPGILPPPTVKRVEAFQNLGIEQKSPNALVVAWHSRFAPVKNVQLNDRIPPDIDVSGFANSDIVSRIHADIRLEGGIYYIEDVGSSNGTYINNLPLSPGNRHRLRPGDRISLGKGDLVVFLFQSA